MSTAAKRHKYSKEEGWTCPRPPLLHPVESDTDGYTSTTEGMQNNGGNNYAWLFRERPVNLVAQEELLNMIPIEQSLPPEVVDRLGAHIGATEICAAIQLLKDGKAPDSLENPRYHEPTITSRHTARLVPWLPATKM